MIEIIFKTGNCDRNTLKLLPKCWHKTAVKRGGGCWVGKTQCVYCFYNKAGSNVFGAKISQNLSATLQRLPLQEFNAQASQIETKKRQR